MTVSHIISLRAKKAYYSLHTKRLKEGEDRGGGALFKNSHFPSGERVFNKRDFEKNGRNIYNVASVVSRNINIAKIRYYTMEYCKKNVYPFT